MKYQTLIASLVLALVASPAFADNHPYKPKGQYKGQYYDSYRATMYYIGLNGGITGMVIDPDTYISTAFSVNAGYNFNEFFAADLTYVNFGKMNMDSAGVQTGTGYSVGAVALLPLSRTIALFGKLGFATTNFVTENIGVSEKSNPSPFPTTAVGVAYSINKKTDIRLTYDTFKRVNATSGLMNNLSVSSIGVMFKF